MERHDESHGRRSSAQRAGSCRESDRRHNLRGGWSLGDHAPYPTSRFWHRRRRPFNRPTTCANEFYDVKKICSSRLKRTFSLREQVENSGAGFTQQRLKSLVTIVNFSSLNHSIHCFTAGAQSSVNNQSNETIKYRFFARSPPTMDMSRANGVNHGK